jgi:hypothetical protein
MDKKPKKGITESSAVMPAVKFKPEQREDGLMVFFDEGSDEFSEKLNHIRKTAPPSMVIGAVALFRGLQIGRSYAMKYAPELLEQVEQTIEHMLERFASTKLPK